MNRRHTDFQYGEGGRQNRPILLGNAVLKDKVESHYRYIIELEGQIITPSDLLLKPANVAVGGEYLLILDFSLAGL